MPQTINSWWKQHLGDDWEITHELFLHSLGNLTLTAYNSELHNADFVVKCTEYKKSHLELNKYFFDKSSWKREDIEARSAVLSEIILTIWPYFGDESIRNPKLERLKVKGSHPRLVRIFGEEFSTKSWRDVLEKTMNTIAKLEPDKFKEIVEQFPRFIGWEQQDFRSTRKLENGAFIEVNLSAKDIHKFCVKAIETIDLDTGDWYVETNE
jgi:hypothetical protein